MASTQIKSRVGRVVVWVALVVAFVWAWYALTSRIELLPASEARPAPALTMHDLEGGSIDLEDLRGKIVLINLWASWCGPCRREIPGLAKLDTDYRDRGLVVLGLNVDDLPRPEIAPLAEGLGVTYPVVVAGSRMTGPFATAGVIPHTWLIDRDGRIRASHSGYASAGSFDAACRRLLGEDGG